MPDPARLTEENIGLRLREKRTAEEGAARTKEQRERAERALARLARAENVVEAARRCAPGILGGVELRRALAAYDAQKKNQDA